MEVNLITVCYNSERWIKDALNSVLKQTYRNINLIIVDGKSEDRTLNVIFDYVKIII